ncbi:peptidylprolyl isomerase [Clostridium sp. DL1XJH146]
MENKILAVVNGSEIKESDIQEAIMRFPQERRAMFANEQGKKQLLDQLVSFELFYSYGKEIEIEKNEEYTKRLEVLVKELSAQVAIESVLKNVKLDEEDVTEYYNANKDMFKTGETATASHILIDTEEKASEIKKEIEEGLSFEEAAQKYSSCPSKAQGGSLGAFSRGQMVKEFEDAAFVLPLNEVSEPVKTQFGFHLIKVSERQESKAQELDEVRSQIMNSLFQQKQNELYAGKVEELKEKFEVKYL